MAAYGLFVGCRRRQAWLQSSGSSDSAKPTFPGPSPTPSQPLPACLLAFAAIGAGEATWNTLERVSYVWLKNRWVAYPFQNNISALDKEDQVGGLAWVGGDGWAAWPGWVGG